jgi:hypothetical protein
MRWKPLLSIFAVGLGLVVWFAYPRGVRAAGDQDGEGAPAAEPSVESSTLVELRARPAHRRGETLRFVLQFEGLVETWNPYLTRFGTTDWVAFRAWANERFPWDPEVYRDPAPFLFLRRGTNEALRIERARAHDRFEVTAIVREIFLGEPWIEILTLDSLVERVPEGTLLHVGRGRAFEAQGQWETALEQYGRAGAAPLPPLARAELERIVTECEAQAAAAREQAERRR